MQKSRSEKGRGPGDDASSKGLNRRDFNGDVMENGVKDCLQIPGDENISCPEEIFGLHFLLVLLVCSESETGPSPRPEIRKMEPLLTQFHLKLK